MQMGPKEIAVEYRTAANKQKQIKVLAELNQCAERKIAEILDDEGVELPKIWQAQLMKPARRSRKFPEGEASRESSVVSREETEAEQAAPVAADARRGEDPSTPAAPPLRMTGEAEPVTDRDLFDAVATLLPEAERQRPGENGVPVAPRNADEARHWVDGLGPVPVEPAVAKINPDAWEMIRNKPAEPVPVDTPSVTAAGGDSSLGEGVRDGISCEQLLRAACRMLTSALDLEPDRYYTYSCGVLDLVHALTEEEV